MIEKDGRLYPHLVICGKCHRVNGVWVNVPATEDVRVRTHQSHMTRCKSKTVITLSPVGMILEKYHL